MAVDILKNTDPYSPPETHLVDRMRYWCLAAPDKVAFHFVMDRHDEIVQLTYQQLDERVRAVAAKLNSQVARGQRAILMYQGTLDFVVAFFACHYAGIIAVPAYPPRRNRRMGRINAIAEDCNAAIALTTAEVIRRKEGLIDDCDSLQNIPWLATEEVPIELSGDWVLPDVDREEIGLLQYTSGSTGSPKGVVLTHANIMANLRYISEAFEIDRTCIGVTWLPPYHDMGLIGGLLMSSFLGGTSIAMSPIHFLTKPIRWLRTISNFEAQVSGGPNFAYSLCVNRIDEEDCEGLDLSSWQVAFNGAEPIRSDTLDAFTKKFEPYGFNHRSHYPCYGMAETTLLVTGSSISQPPIYKSVNRRDLAEHRVVPIDADAADARILVGCGHPVDDEKVIIVHPETRTQLAQDEIGEIWVGSESVGKGYWNKPEETERTFQATLVGNDTEHFLRTGDLGFMQGNELFVTGRLKDMIVIRGVNRYPQDIETTVEQVSDRLQDAGAAAFAIESWERERLLVVCEVDRLRVETDWNTIIEQIRAAVTDQHDLPPDGIILVRAGSIPKTSSGKVQRRACRDDYLNKRLLVVAQWLSWEKSEPADREKERRTSQPIDNTLLNIVIDHVRQVAKERGKNLNADTNIVIDLGLDSLERLQIANSLEDTFGGRFPDDVLQEIETIGEISAALKEHIGDRPIVAPLVNRDSMANKLGKKGPVPPSHYEIDQMPEFIRVQQLRSVFESTGIRNPFFSMHEGVIADTTKIDGRELISFSSYNYINLSGHPEVDTAAKAAIDQYGTSSSASRLVSGEKTVHKQLEAELSDFLGVEDVITMAGGHATNESTIGHLVGSGDLILHDSLAHNSIIQGAALSGARRRPFEHNNWRELDEILSEIRHEYRRVLVAIEGLYSMDGDAPDLSKFVEVKKKHKVWLFVDEAHSIGTLGKTGRGCGELHGVERLDVEVWMGTLSKSLGSVGGFIAGKRSLIEYLRYTNPGFVFAAALAPANAAAALEALRVLRREPERVHQLAENSRLFLALAREAGLNTGLSEDSPIIPIITGNSLQALQLSEALYLRGFNVQPILHPAVEEEKARLRFFISSAHNEQQIRAAVAAVADEYARIAPSRMNGKLMPSLTKQRIS